MNEVWQVTHEWAEPSKWYPDSTPMIFLNAGQALEYYLALLDNTTVVNVRLGRSLKWETILERLG